MTSLSLVTGTYKRPDSLARLVTSIMVHTQLDWELLIADGDGSAEAWAKHERIRVIPDGETPLGHTKAYNRCFRMCQGEWVLWLNDDAEVEPGYDVYAVSFMRTHPAIGLGCLYYREKRGDKFTEYHINRYRGMLYANFGILAKEFGDSLGWFDEDFPMYGADNSLAFRTLLAGRGIAGISDAHLVHHSEQDEVRAANQEHRKVVSGLFNSKYGQYMDQMHRTFTQLALPEDIPHIPTQRRARLHRRTS